jgi:hypothetical protein
MSVVPVCFAGAGLDVVVPELFEGFGYPAKGRLMRF